MALVPSAISPFASTSLKLWWTRKLRRTSRGGLEPALRVAEWGVVKKHKISNKPYLFTGVYHHPLTPPTPSLEKRGKKAREMKGVKDESSKSYEKIFLFNWHIIGWHTFKVLPQP